MDSMNLAEKYKTVEDLELFIDGEISVTKDMVKDVPEGMESVAGEYLQRLNAIKKLIQNGQIKN